MANNIKQAYRHIKWQQTIKTTIPYIPLDLRKNNITLNQISHLNEDIIHIKTEADMEHHAFLCSGGINKSRLNPLWDHRPIPRQIVGFRRWLESTHRRDCRYLGASKKNEDISFWYIGHQEHPHIGGAFCSVWHCWLQGDWTLFVVIVCISALCLLRRGGLAWIPL